MAYITISNSEIDANSPLNFSLGRKFRDNPEAIADGTAPIKYLLPPARCSTGAGMFRPDGAGRVISSPYLTGVPSVFFSASSVWQIPKGWYRLHIELWGAGDTPTAGPGLTVFESGCWGEVFTTVTPLTSLTITLGQPSGSVGGDSTLTGVGISLLAPGGSSASIPDGFSTFDRTGAKAGGFQYLNQPSDGARNYGGNGFVLNSPGAAGFCKITGMP